MDVQLDDQQHVGAILAGVDVEGLRPDLNAIRERKLVVAVVLPPAQRERLHELGVRHRVAEIPKRAPRSSWEDEGWESRAGREERATPFPFVMQSLVREWRNRML